VKRFELNGFDLASFAGKRCLDIGTGSGRYALMMAAHGGIVSACDVSEAGLETARERTKGIASIDFRHASALALPYADNEFDFVCCAGVLHHTPSIERGLDEITRVLRPGGSAFLLLYGAGGIRWMMVKAFRPWAAEFGYDALDAAIRDCGLPENNRKHFLDDLFVPILDQTSWSALQGQLAARDFRSTTRWQRGHEYDHEADGPTILADMKKIAAIFDQFASHRYGDIVTATASEFIALGEDLQNDRDAMIGEGLHRVIAMK
jgi:SAM-dependent methyltransferase